MKNRNILKIILLVVLAVAGFGFDDDCGTSTPASNVSSAEAQAMADNVMRLRKQYPLPQLKDSNELKNLVKRADFLNKSETVGYVYLLSHGNVMAFYSVQGKVTSLNAYMTATTANIKDPNGSVDAGSMQVETPDVDGAYGKNDDGIFFFTTEGTYVEWKGEYLYSNQPLKLVQPVQLQQQVK